MAAKIYIVKATYESYSSTECVTEGVYSSMENALKRYNLLVNEVKTRINDGELDGMTLKDVHETNGVQTNYKGEEKEVHYTYIDYDDLRDTFEIEEMWLDDKEPSYTPIPGFEDTMEELNAIRI